MQIVKNFELEIDGKLLREIINEKAVKWHDFFIRENVPIYHYTSQKGLESILSSNSIWFSDSEALNDTSEGKYLYSLLSFILDNYQDSSKSFETFKQQIYNCIINVENGVIFNYTSSHGGLRHVDEESHYFICSFCENNDALNMWQYYTKSENRAGYNIKFFLNDFLQSIKNCSDLNGLINVRAYRVLYNIDEQTAFLKQVITFFYEIWKNTLYKEFVLNDLAEYLYVIKFALKHPAFEQEKEIRIISKVSKNVFDSALTNDQVKIRFGNDLYIPYISVVFEKNLIKHIKASPLTNNFESVRYILQKYNYEDVEIDKSNIPIRY